MSLSAAKKTIERDGRTIAYPVKSLAACLQGGLAMLALGQATPAAAGAGGNVTAKANDAATCSVVGVFAESVTGGAADGDKLVNVRSGVFCFKNSAGAEALSTAQAGQPCYVIDDETVAKTSGDGVRPRAGLVVDVDAEGVWVAVSPAIGGSKRTVTVPFQISETDLLAGTAQDLVSPVKGQIIGLTTIIQKAVTTGGPITAAVGVTAVDGLSCVIADAAAKGTIVSDTPTAGHASRAVDAGSRIQVIPDAAFATAGAVNGFIEIAY
ncbi:MAG: hypothetical protein ACXW3D_01345 [Caulobacteraceae bacterium]